MVGHFQAKHSVHTTTTFVILLFVYITSCTPYMQTKFYDMATRSNKNSSCTPYMQTSFTTWPQGVTRTCGVNAMTSLSDNVSILSITKSTVSRDIL